MRPCAALHCAYFSLQMRTSTIALLTIIWLRAAWQAKDSCLSLPGHTRLLYLLTWAFQRTAGSRCSFHGPARLILVSWCCLYVLHLVMLGSCLTSVPFCHAERCRELSDEAYTWGTGTSIAAPHVAGVAAIYLARNPAALPHELKATVLAASTKSAIDPSLLQPGTPNRLLYSNLEVASGGNAIVEAAAGPDRR